MKTRLATVALLAVALLALPARSSYAALSDYINISDILSVDRTVGQDKLCENEPSCREPSEEEKHAIGPMNPPQFAMEHEIDGLTYAVYFSYNKDKKITRIAFIRFENMTAEEYFKLALSRAAAYKADKQTIKECNDDDDGIKESFERAVAIFNKKYKNGAKRQSCSDYKDDITISYKMDTFTLQGYTSIVFRKIRGHDGSTKTYRKISIGFPLF